MRRTSLLSWGLAGALLSLGPAPGDGPGEVGQGPGEGGPLHTVERRALTLRSRLEGRLEAELVHRVRLLPQAYTGPLVVERVHRRGGALEAADPILSVDSARLEEELEAAERQVSERELRLEHARRELEVLEQRHSTRLEQRELALARARADLELWTEHHGPRLLKASELGLRQAQDAVQNQREELLQLEGMYAGTELDSETKDIVLERARRALAIAEERLLLSEGEHQVTVEVIHPRRALDAGREVAARAEELAHSAIEQAIAGERKALEIAALEVALEEARTRSSRLRGDSELLQVRAPAGGILARIELEPGDSIQARQAIARILDPARLVLRVEAGAADLRLLRVGQELDLVLPEYPEVELSAAVADIGALGRGREHETVFDVELAVRGEYPLLRLGLRAVACAEHTLEGVLAIPRRAVDERGAESFATLVVEGQEVRRALKLGPGDGEWVQVLAGLEVGDRVRLAADG